MSDLALLRSALGRIASAQEWASQAKLLNIGGELRKAASEIRDYLNSVPTRSMENDPPF
jgi:hypothetical protein